MILRKATYQDVVDIMRIMEQARAAQRSAGNRQWADGYPSEDTIIKDITGSSAFVLEDNGAMAGYVAISFSDEEYDNHPELWDTSVKYAVMHRIALSDAFRGKGVSKCLFDLSESFIASCGIDCIRIDTGLLNKSMQHILRSRGYRCLGECDFVWGKRLAYENRKIGG